MEVMTGAALKIGDVARQLGTSARTLRYYEEQGLLTPPRTAKGTRLYAPRHVARFRAALKLIALGIPLEQVVALTRARPGAPSGSVSSRKVLQELHRLRQSIRDRQRRMDAILDEIQKAAALVSQCLDCTKEPSDATCPECPCSTRFDTAELLALTWSIDYVDASTDDGDS